MRVYDITGITIYLCEIRYSIRFWTRILENANQDTHFRAFYDYYGEGFYLCVNSVRYSDGRVHKRYVAYPLEVLDRHVFRL